MPPRKGPSVPPKGLPPSDEAERPSPGEVLSSLPAWPREWAQRLGREATKLGAEMQVRKGRRAGTWQLQWLIDHRPLFALEEATPGVWVELSLFESEATRMAEDPQTDEEFRARIAATAPMRGRRKLRVPLDSSRRANTLSLFLRCRAHGYGP